MPFEINKTELVWPGKYDADGNLVQAPRVSLPFQVIERVNETRATREAKKAEGLTLFDVWDGANEGATFEDGWRNKLIWGENAAVMSSLLDQFSGRFDLIYIDPPFDSNVDYKKKIQIKNSEIRNDSSVFEEYSKGEIISRISNDLPNITLAVTGIMTELCFCGTLLIVIMYILIFHISLKLTLIAFTITSA